jgi:hypothetical protein
MEDDKKPIISSEVKKVKANPAKKFADLFIAEDVNTAKGYVLTNFVIPGIKNGILELLRTMFYGKGGGSSSYSSFGSNVTRINYWKGPNSNVSNIKANSYVGMRDYDHIMVASMSEAEAIIDYLSEVMERYKRVSIANLYEAASSPSNRIPIEATDYKYGWISMRGFDILPKGDGWYLIKTPRPVPLD